MPLKTGSNKFQCCLGTKKIWCSITKLGVHSKFSFTQTTILLLQYWIWLFTVDDDQVLFVYSSLS